MHWGKKKPNKIEVTAAINTVNPEIIVFIYHCDFRKMDKNGD